MCSRIILSRVPYIFILIFFIDGTRFHAQTAPITGNVKGTIVDPSGDVVPNAQVILTSLPNSNPQKSFTDRDGNYSFSNVASGPFKLSITAKGFAAQTSTGSLLPGEIHDMPDIELPLAGASINVTVHATQQEIAEVQLKADEQQRLIGFIPNFYVEYDHQFVPLTTKQKYKLATKSTFDYTTFPITGAIAGIQQGLNDFSGYGQGAQGYAERYAAGFATFSIASYLSGAVLPSIFKQDPRYFYKGTGSKKSRILYALANAVICKGDNDHWQPNYSALLGGLAASGISNVYYPAASRNGVALTFENFSLSILGSGGANIFQEFFSRKFSKGIQK